MALTPSLPLIFVMEIFQIFNKFILQKLTMVSKKCIHFKIKKKKTENSIL